MATKQGGGAGVFGWTLLGFLAGVAATLAVQMLLLGSNHGDDTDEDNVRPATATVVTPRLAAPTIAHHATAEEQEARAEAKAILAGDTPPIAPAASAAPPKRKARPTPQDTDPEVADDAAAAGMTSRAKPADDIPN